MMRSELKEGGRPLATVSAACLLIVLSHASLEAAPRSPDPVVRLPSPAGEVSFSEAAAPRASNRAARASSALIAEGADGPQQEAVAQKAGQRRAAVRTSMVLKVGSKDEAAADLLRYAESLGGYLSQLTEQSIAVKIPTAMVQRYLEHAEGLGVVVDRDYSSEELGGQLDLLATRIEGRREVMARYFSALEKSGEAPGVVMVEKELTQLIAEIENTEGSLKLLEHRLAFAQVRIEFRFKDRKAPVANGYSSFPWLNTMNMVDLVEDFRYER